MSGTPEMGMTRLSRQRATMGLRQIQETPLSARRPCAETEIDQRGFTWRHDCSGGLSFGSNAWVSIAATPYFSSRAISPSK
jgi:hypothetical protein